MNDGRYGTAAIRNVTAEGYRKACFHGKNRDLKHNRLIYFANAGVGSKGQPSGPDKKPPGRTGLL
ncbi:MAG: hypothetical protein WBZ29_06385 [Methanocella sp.]